MVTLNISAFQNHTLLKHSLRKMKRKPCLSASLQFELSTHLKAFQIKIKLLGDRRALGQEHWRHYRKHPLRTKHSHHTTILFILLFERFLSEKKLFLGLLLPEANHQMVFYHLLIGITWRAVLTKKINSIKMIRHFYLLVFHLSCHSKRTPEKESKSSNIHMFPTWGYKQHPWHSLKGIWDS